MMYSSNCREQLKTVPVRALQTNSASSYRFTQTCKLREFLKHCEGKPKIIPIPNAIEKP